LCKEQQHSKKQEFFIFMVLLKLPQFFKPADLAVCIFLFLCSFICFSGNSEYIFVFMRVQCRRSSAQMSCREVAGVSFVALGVLEPQKARQ
jgi:hypothetical protein